MISRRGLMAGLAAFGVGSWRPAAATSVADRLLGALRDRAAAARLGAHVMTTLPPNTTRATLAADLLARRAALAAVIEGRDDDALPALFEDTVREDLQRGRTRIAAGWVLAQTEAELCALAHLS